MTFDAVLIGSDSLTLACGRMLVEAGHRLRAVATRHAPTRAWAEGAGIPVTEPGPGLAGRLPRLRLAPVGGEPRPPGRRRAGAAPPGRGQLPRRAAARGARGSTSRSGRCWRAATRTRSPGTGSRAASTRGASSPPAPCPSRRTRPPSRSTPVPRGGDRLAPGGAGRASPRTAAGAPQDLGAPRPAPPPRRAARRRSSTPRARRPTCCGSCARSTTGATRTRSPARRWRFAGGLARVTGAEAAAGQGAPGHGARGGGGRA